MKKHSCGAILYTIYKKKIYIILGMEKGQWFPFKGTRDKGETNEQAAIREIYEETCGTVSINNIELKCSYSTKRKHYHIGLVQTNVNIINDFYQNRDRLIKEYDYSNVYNDEYHAFLEKSNVKMFALDTIFTNKFHEITIEPINYYYSHLKLLQNKLSMESDNSKVSPYFSSMSNNSNFKETMSVLKV